MDMGRIVLLGNVQKYQATGIEQEVNYEMMEILMMEMVAQLQPILLMMDIYDMGDLQLHKINVSNEHQGTIQIPIKINE